MRSAPPHSDSSRLAHQMCKQTGRRTCGTAGDDNLYRFTAVCYIEQLDPEVGGVQIVAKDLDVPCFVGAAQLSYSADVVKISSSF